MKIGILGTGVVGQTISARLIDLGHDVMMGTRDPAITLARDEPDMYGNPPFHVWREQHSAVKLGTFAETAAHGELLFNCTNGEGSLSALASAGEANLDGKVLVDISNPLDASRGIPPSLFVSNTDSLGEQIQRTFPNVRVVKTLNTVTAFLMVDPGQLAGGDHSIFVSGNDAAAKVLVTDILEDWLRLERRD
jgi:8-hydroxy-5-deazaflavin:NADPH oxidoreductase